MGRRPIRSEEDNLGAAHRSRANKVAAKKIRLRVERQTSLFLPRTGAILLTIRVFLTPFTRLGPD
jgi:hypothetical protein